MKKILLFLEDFKIGGVEKSLLDLTEKLSAYPLKITVLTYGDDFSLLSKSLINDNVKIKKVFNIKKVVKSKNVLFNKFLNYVNVLIMHIYLLFKKYDVIVNYHYCQNWRYSLIKFHCKKYIAVYHDGVIYNECFSEKVTKNLHKLLFVSNEVKENIEKNFSYLNDKTELIGNIIDYDKIIRKSAEYDVDFSGDLNIVTVARLTSDKGIDLAVEAASLLKQYGMDFKWYFVGNGAELKNLEELVCKFGLESNVVFAGFNSNPYPYIKNCDLYVQPSKSESFGITILEALILQKNIISTKTVGPLQYFSRFSNVNFCDISSDAIANSIIKTINQNSLADITSVKQYIEDSNNSNINKWVNLLS